MKCFSLSSGDNEAILQQPQQDPASSYYGYFAHPPLPGQPPGFPAPNGWNGLYPTQYPPPGSFGPPGFSGFMPQHYPGWTAGAWLPPGQDPYAGFYVKPKRSDKNAFRPIIK
jgi:hypothetical protein